MDRVEARQLELADQLAALRDNFKDVSDMKHSIRDVREVAKRLLKARGTLSKGKDRPESASESLRMRRESRRQHVALDEGKERPPTRATETTAHDSEGRRKGRSPKSPRSSPTPRQKAPNAGPNRSTTFSPRSRRGSSESRGDPDSKGTSEKSEKYSC